MKIKCEYCGNYIDESEEKCQGCGAINKAYKRVANQVPTTIEELKIWYQEHNLPPKEVTRFFIGEDFKEPKAFGIYKDEATGKFIVYKNKDTGERAVRYEGKDEKYAVNELYLKLKEEILHQKELNTVPREANSYIRPYSNSNKSITSKDIIELLFVVSVIVLFALIFFFQTPRGYYSINNNEYYYVNGSWYKYNQTEEKWESSAEPNHKKRLKKYYDGNYYNFNSSYSDIKYSDVYDNNWDYHYSSGSGSSSGSSWSSSDWDSGSSWSSSDSWSSGGTDWGSDW